MANEIQLSARFTVTSGNIQESVTPNLLLSLSSSLSFFGTYTQNLITGSWVALNTGSATNKQALVVVNQSVSSSITIATSANGSGSFATLTPTARTPNGGFTFLQPSTGATYYLLASSNGTGQAQLQIGITE